VKVAAIAKGIDSPFDGPPRLYLLPNNGPAAE
jgi:hypothetical protein